MTPPASTTHRGHRGTVLRLGLAAALFALVFYLVPIRDRLEWPSRFPEGLTGHLERQGEEVVFTDREGSPVVRLRIADYRDGEARYDQAVIEDGGRPEVLALSEAEQKELLGQPVEGLWTTLRRLQGGYFAAALALYLLAACVSFVRWHLLLHAVHVRARLRRVIRLGFMGLFFSNIIPGMTGGDLVKAIYVARDHPRQRPEAVLSVLVDRAIGLFGLACIASVVLLYNFERYRQLALMVSGVLVAILAFAAVLFSRRVRRLLRLDRLLGLLPAAELLRKLDRSVLLYRAAPGTVVLAMLMSFVVHGVILTAIGLIGQGLGIGLPLVAYYALAPLPLIVQAIPVAPAGIGVGEVAFVYFFHQATGQTTAQAALALSLSYRAVQILVSLAGGAALLAGHESRITEQELEEAAHPADGA